MHLILFSIRIYKINDEEELIKSEKKEEKKNPKKLHIKGNFLERTKF